MKAILNLEFYTKAIAVHIFINGQHSDSKIEDYRLICGSVQEFWDFISIIPLKSNKHIRDDLNSYLKADLLSHNYNAPIGFYVCNCSCFQVKEKWEGTYHHDVK